MFLLYMRSDVLAFWNEIDAFVMIIVEADSFEALYYQNYNCIL